MHTYIRGACMYASIQPSKSLLMIDHVSSPAGFCQYIVGGTSLFRVAVCPPRKPQGPDPYPSPIFASQHEPSPLPSAAASHAAPSPQASPAKSAPEKPKKPLPPLPAKPNKPLPPVPVRRDDGDGEAKGAQERDLLMD